MEIDGDTIEVIEVDEDDDADGTEIYGEEVGIEFNEEMTDGFAAPRTNSGGPVTIYRLIKLEHAEALGISLQEGSVTTPNQKTKIITRNIIKLSKPPKNMVLAQKNTRPAESSRQSLTMVEDKLAINPRRRFICKLCNKGFRHASHLKRHINSHTGERLYDCEVCTKKFLDVSTLCRHRRTHTGDRPYMCKICEKSFGTLGSLRRHVTVHNQEARPFCCTICHKRFPDNSSFHKHRLIHTGIKPHECNVCAKSFVHVGDLNGHKKVHEETKPWKCNRCNKEFSKQSNCARHSLIHEGNKDFICHLCGVGYNFQSSLTRHLLTHRTKEKPTRKTGRRKVVILTEVEGKGRSENLEPSKLTLRQIKYLVRENKINFVEDSGDEDGSESIQVSVVGLQDDTGSEEIVEIDLETVCEDKEQIELAPQGLPDESSKLKEEISGSKQTIIINHVTNDGDVNYVIEEA